MKSLSRFTCECKRGLTTTQLMPKPHSVLTYQMIAEKPVVNDLPQLKMPVLLVIGQKDRTVFGRRFAPPEAVKSLGNFPELGKKAQAAIPNAQLVPIENVGHVPHVEVPDVFVKTVVQFLNAKN